ncbi:MAG: glycosyltransferase family 4 protein [Kiritimatiellae bacterium]|nr:glycosyltransferase family 4 protein [Kiritimatiellia bacterium]
MNIVVWLNWLGIGGTEKAALIWAGLLAQRGHRVSVLSLASGPRAAAFERAGIQVRVVECSAKAVANALNKLRPDVIHAHVPGYPHAGDVLGAALGATPLCPVVQTNVFGRLDNPTEATWTYFRLFVSWTSCVQAAERAGRRLDRAFFRRQSVAVNPLPDPVQPDRSSVAAFRARLHLGHDDILFGRLARPDPYKWDDSMLMSAFDRASRKDTRLRLLLREPPPAMTEAFRRRRNADKYRILAATDSPEELHATIGALDVLVNASAIGESFGYAIAEAMQLGKPVIANLTPWQDMAQVELVRQGECGLLVGTSSSLCRAMLLLARHPELRFRLGEQSRRHIAQLADQHTSTSRLEACLQAAIQGRDNPYLATDVATACQSANYLREHNWGHSAHERTVLRGRYALSRLRSYAAKHLSEEYRCRLRAVFARFHA